MSEETNIYKAPISIATEKAFNTALRTTSNAFAFDNLGSFSTEAKDLLGRELASNELVIQIAGNADSDSVVQSDRIKIAAAAVDGALNEFTGATTLLPPLIITDRPISNHHAYKGEIKIIFRLSKPVKEFDSLTFEQVEQLRALTTRNQKDLSSWVGRFNSFTRAGHVNPFTPNPSEIEWDKSIEASFRNHGTHTKNFHEKVELASESLRAQIF